MRRLATIAMAMLASVTACTDGAPDQVDAPSSNAEAPAPTTVPAEEATSTVNPTQPDEPGDSQTEPTATAEEPVTDPEGEVPTEPADLNPQPEQSSALETAGLPTSLEVGYLGAVQHSWTIELNDITRAVTGDPTESQIHLQASFTYNGENDTGQLLDLAIALTDGTTNIDALRAPCIAAPPDALDMFATVAQGDTATGTLCFATDLTPTAIEIKPLIDDPIIVQLTN